MTDMLIEDIEQKEEKKLERVIQRGEVYYIDLGEEESALKDQTSVQRGKRPVVVVSSVAGCGSCKAILVAPMTTKLKGKSCNARVMTSTGKECEVLCNQIFSVKRSALKSNRKIPYRLKLEEVHAVDKAIMTSFGLWYIVKEAERGGITYR